MARKPTQYDNTEVKAFLIELETMDYRYVPRWMDDCISGAASQVAGTQKFSPANLFNILRTLDIITSESVLNLLNRKREVIGDALVSERYAQYVAKAARCASNAIAHHHNYFEVEVKKETLPEIKPLPYSDEEMACIRYLSLNAPFAELVAYEKLLKEQYEEVTNV